MPDEWHTYARDITGVLLKRTTKKKRPRVAGKLKKNSEISY
jgi:hypothetical protein